MNMSELTVENLGSWPKSAKLGAIGIVFLLILILGYFLLIQPKLDELAKANNQQITLKATYLTKAKKAATLPAYQAQLVQVQALLKELLNHLTSPEEIPGLLEQISKIGLANGLDFKLIKPGDEVDKDYYAELPIEIQVTGSYHNIAMFVSQVAELQRLVTFNDFVISPYNPKTVKGSGGADVQPTAGGPEILEFDATARTYRYIEKKPEENKDAKSKKANKGVTGK